MNSVARVTRQPDELLDHLGLDRSALESIERVCLVACTSSAHAAAVGRFWIERFAAIPVHVERAPVHAFAFRRTDLVVVVSQGGATAESRSAVTMAHLRARAVLLIAADRTQTAEPELVSQAMLMGQLDDLLVLAVSLGRRRDVLSPADAERMLGTLRRLGVAGGTVAQVAVCRTELDEVAQGSAAGVVRSSYPGTHAEVTHSDPSPERNDP